MMKALGVLLILFIVNISNAQSSEDKEGVKKACLGYLEGFYEGDTLKLINSLKPSLHKFGYWKKKDGSGYDNAGHMTFNQAKNYAKGVKENKNFPKEDAPKKVEILDIGNHIASAKVTAWWGIDFLLLSREGDKWMIEQVLWEGPLEKD